MKLLNKLPEFFLIKHSIFFEWLIPNIFGIGLIFIAYLNGWITTVLSTDIFYIIPTMIFIFTYGVILSGYKCFDIGNQIYQLNTNPYKNKIWNNYRNNVLNRTDAARPSIDRALELKLTASVQIFSIIRGSLIMMGFIGTIIGISIGLGYLDVSAFSDPNLAPGVIGNFLHDYGFALYTTLIGGIGWLWTYWNHHVILKGLYNFVAMIYETNGKQFDHLVDEMDEINE